MICIQIQDTMITTEENNLVVLQNENITFVKLDLAKKVNELINGLIKIFVTKSINYSLL